MTHYEYIQREKAAGRWSVSTECRAYHLTFGGRCLNCGHDPDKHNQHDKRQKDEADD